MSGRRRPSSATETIAQRRADRDALLHWRSTRQQVTDASEQLLAAPRGAVSLTLAVGERVEEGGLTLYVEEENAGAECGRQLAGRQYDTSAVVVSIPQMITGSMASFRCLASRSRGAVPARMGAGTRFAVATRPGAYVIR